MWRPLAKLVQDRQPELTIVTSDGFSVGRELEATSLNLTKNSPHSLPTSFVNEIPAIKKF